MTRFRRACRVAGLAVAAGSCAIGCGTGGSVGPAPRSAPRSAPASRTSTPTPRRHLASTPSRRTARPVVARRVVTVVDHAAGTPARGPAPASPARVLRTTVWFPAPPDSPDRVVPARFPLVVFAHGFDVTPAVYSRFLRQLAQSGYVVAAPTFPISAAGRPGAPREDDMPNQALDVRAVITAMLAASHGRGWLAGGINPAAVAVVGHSDGGETAAAALLVPTDQDPRIRAVVMVGGQLPTWGSFDPVAVPALVVQGDADTINPPWLSQQLYRRLAHPKAYLDVIAGTHLPLLTGADARARVTRAAVIDFLDAELRHSRAARERFRRVTHRPGVTLLRGGL